MYGQMANGMRRLNLMKYAWDETKNRTNQKKHGVSFEEAMTVIESADYAQVLDDSSDEHRFKAIGMSARKATKSEVKLWHDVKK